MVMSFSMIVKVLVVKKLVGQWARLGREAPSSVRKERLLSGT